MPFAPRLRLLLLEGPEQVGGYLLLFPCFPFDRQTSSLRFALPARGVGLTPRAAAPAARRGTGAWAGSPTTSAAASASAACSRTTSACSTPPKSAKSSRCARRPRGGGRRRRRRRRGKGGRRRSWMSRNGYNEEKFLFVKLLFPKFLRANPPKFLRANPRHRHRQVRGCLCKLLRARVL